MKLRFKYFDTAKEEPFIPCLNIDLHSHLIPNIDDGSKDMKESLALLRALEEAGYYKVITTPHVMIDGYRNTREIIMKGLEGLILAKNKVGLNIEIEAAAEYYFDDGFIKKMQETNPLSIADTYILFETSYLAKPLQFDEMLDSIILAGYIPLFAHPERYRYISNLEEEYSRLKKKGVYFQVNINSFGGHYGKDAQNKAVFLSEHGMIDFLGSDVHHIKQVKTLVSVKEKQVYKEIFKNNLILNNIL
jgi:tyrosine-protein phosphatase YwqE